MDKNLIKTDEEGRILINDSMSDELKEKIEIYNKMYETEILEEELPEGDMPLDETDEVPLDDSFEDDYSSDEVVGGSSDTQVSEEELDSLNDLFS